MIRIITTQYGQLLADVKEDEGKTVIIDAKNYQPIATVQTTERSAILKVIRSMGSIMRMRAKLENIGVEVSPGINLERKAPPKVVKPAPKQTKKVAWVAQ